jgi:hypothetical protein
MHMVSSLDAVTEGFRTVEAAAAHVGDTAPLDDMRASADLAAAAVGRLNSTFDMIDGQIRQNESAQRRFNSEILHGSGLADELRGKIGEIAGMMGAAFGAKASFDFFKDSVGLANERITAEQQLVNVLSNQGALYENFINLKNEAATIQDRTMYNSKSMIGGASELASYIKDASALQSMMGTLANYAAGMSGGTKVSYQQMVDYATQLGKALDGTFDGLSKKGFALSDAQKEIIKNGSDMEKALVIDAVISQSWAGLAEQMANTPQGMMASMANAFDEIRENIGAQLLPGVMEFFWMIEENMPLIEQVLQGIATGVGMVIPVITNALSTVFFWIGLITGYAQQLYQVIVANWSQIAPIVMIIATAIGAVVAAIVLYNTAVGIATLAQNIFNSSLWACPLTWIVIALVAAVLAVYALVAAFNQASGTSISATGIIFGAFSVLGAFLWNLFLGFLDLVLGIINHFYNIFVNFANFLANVFENPVSSIIYLFQNMADSVLAILQKIASAIDFIFGSNLASAVEGWRSSLKGMADALVAKYAPDENYVEYLNKIDLSVADFGLERWAYSDAWQSGYDAGEGFEGTINDFFKTDIPGEIEPPPTTDDYVDTSSLDGIGQSGSVGDIASNTGKTAGNTAKMADFSEDNLKYLRDIAERDAVNRFTTAEVNVDFGGIVNNVNSEMDLDGIVDYIADSLEETLLVVAEGVYA